MQKPQFSNTLHATYMLLIYNNNYCFHFPSLHEVEQIPFTIFFVHILTSWSNYYNYTLQGTVYIKTMREYAIMESEQPSNITLKTMIRDVSNTD